MDEKPMTRVPKQNRSIEKKETILKIATELFSEKGYFNVTTNEISKVAGISIGTLYAYFQDKEEILLAILAKYNIYYFSLFETLSEEKYQKLYANNLEEWTKELFHLLIQIHRDTKEMNREFRSLYFRMPAVNKVLDEQNQKVLDEIQNILILKLEAREDMQIKTFFVHDFISSVVDRIVYKNLKEDEDAVVSQASKIVVNMMDVEYSNNK